MSAKRKGRRRGKAPGRGAMRRLRGMPRRLTAGAVAWASAVWPHRYITTKQAVRLYLELGPRKPWDRQQ